MHQLLLSPTRFYMRWAYFAFEFVFYWIWPESKFINFDVGCLESTVCIFCWQAFDRNTTYWGKLQVVRDYPLCLRCPIRFPNSDFFTKNGRKNVFFFFYFFCHPGTSSHYNWDSNGGYWCPRETVQTHGLSSYPCTWWKGSISWCQFSLQDQIWWKYHLFTRSGLKASLSNPL